MGGYIGSRAVNLSTTAADVSGNATIGGNLTVSGTTVTIDSANAQTVDLGDNDKIRLGDGDDLQIYHDASNSHISNATGNLTLDVAGNIILDADSAEIIFKDGGTSFGRVFNSSGNFYINAPTADTDIIIQGNDGGSNVNALSFDMSAAGAATFNSTITSGAITSSGVITANDYIDLNNSGNRGKIGYDSNNVYLGSTSGTGEIHFKNNIGSTDAPHSSGDTKMVITDTGVGIGTSSITSGFMLDVIGDARFSDAAGDDAVELGWSGGGSVGFVQAYDRGASAFRDLSLNNAMTIKSSGNVGFSTASPEKRVHIFDSTQTNQSIRFGNPSATPYGEINYNSTGSEHLYITSKGTTSGYGNIVFQVGGTPSEAMRIDALGRVGIGVAPAAVADSTGVASLQAGGSFLVHFDIDGSGTTSLTNNVYWNGSAAKALFYGSTSDYYQTGGIHHFRRSGVTSAGSSATLSEIVRFDGDGIKFNGDTAAANALNDYEQGSWTPTITSGGGSTTASHTASECRYVRVGNVINITGWMYNINWAGITDGTYVIITGLPFGSDADYLTPVLLSHNTTNVANGYVDNNGVVYLDNSSGVEFQQQNNDITGDRFMISITLNLAV